MSIHVLKTADAPSRARPLTHRFEAPPHGGVYGWLTPFVADIAARNSAFARRVLNLPRDEIHFIAMVLSLMTDGARAAIGVEILARSIGVNSRERILGELAPHIDPRFARFARKLGGGVWRPVSYRRLADLALEPHARKTLGHLRTVTRRDIITLARLPAAYRTLGVLKHARIPRELSRLVFAIEVVRRIRTDLSDRQIIASIEKAEDFNIRRWVEGHYERLPFPPAPTAILTDGRDGVLRPVTSGSDLRRTGGDFDNCVLNYVAQAALGAVVFYRFERGGEKIAVAMLRRTPALGWAVEEVSGPNNFAPSGGDRRAIIEIFARAGIVAAPQAVSRHRWFDLE